MNKKKVGIITFDRALNYGAVLQAYALRKFLSKYDLDVCLIDHQNDNIESQFRLFFTNPKDNNLKNILVSFIKQLIISSRKRNFIIKFNDFRVRYLNPRKVDEYSHFFRVYFGSDQIWNDKITNNDNFYWGEGVNAKEIISYAASAGNELKTILNHKSSLSRFTKIGVREEKLMSKVADIGINCTINIDPVFLLSSDEWKLSLNVSDSKNSKYVLVYSLRDRAKVNLIAEKVAAFYGYKIIEVFPLPTIRNFLSKYSSVSPEEFIGLIANASFIVTDSFHGTAFSIVFRKPFYSIKQQDDKNDRVESLVKVLGLEDRFIKDLNNWPTCEMHYSEIEARLNGLILNSKKFLTESLK